MKKQQVKRQKNDLKFDSDKLKITEARDVCKELQEFLGLDPPLKMFGKTKTKVLEMFAEAASLLEPGELEELTKKTQKFLKFFIPDSLINNKPEEKPEEEEEPKEEEEPEEEEESGPASVGGGDEPSELEEKPVLEEDPEEEEPEPVENLDVVIDTGTFFSLKKRGYGSAPAVLCLLDDDYKAVDGDYLISLGKILIEIGEEKNLDE